MRSSLKKIIMILFVLCLVQPVSMFANETNTNNETKEIEMTENSFGVFEEKLDIKIIENNNDDINQSTNDTDISNLNSENVEDVNIQIGEIVNEPTLDDETDNSYDSMIDNNLDNKFIIDEAPESTVDGGLTDNNINTADDKVDDIQSESHSNSISDEPNGEMSLFAIGESDLSSYVTSLTLKKLNGALIDNTGVDNGNGIKINVSFDIPNSEKINPGDYILIDWIDKNSTYNGAYFLARPETIPLTINGVDLADLVVEADKAMIIFKSVNENLTDIGGYAEINKIGRAHV